METRTVSDIPDDTPGNAGVHGFTQDEITAHIAQLQGQHAEIILTDVTGDTLSILGDVTNATPRNTPHMMGRRWFITWNNPPPQAIHILLDIPGLIKYAIQEETGEEGTPHLQGCLVFDRDYNWDVLRTRAKIYWRLCRSLHASRNYCTKMRSRSGKRWIAGFTTATGVDKVIDPLHGKTLYAYQKQLDDLLLTVPDDRTIYWLWSRKGAIGKSSWVKHACIKYDAIIVGAKHRDAHYAICQRIEAKRPVKTVIFDIPRSQGNEIDYISIESIKNGCFFSGKYKAAMVMYNPPHVIVFANMAPVRHQLSGDRWKVQKLDDEPDLAHIVQEF